MENRQGSVKPSSELVKTKSGTISRNAVPLTVGALELQLYERYPREDAESWDRMGLLVGDPAALVKKVLVALDATAPAIDAAARAGANVLLTHHPVFLDAPCEFKPLGSWEPAVSSAAHTSSRASSFSGALVASALQQGVALMNVHTALDCAPEASSVLPTLLSFECEGVLSAHATGSKKGYGQICKPADGAPLKLEHLAARCLSVFQMMPRVWGSPSDVIRRIAVVNGSATSMLDDCARVQADCLVCGELHYHSALEALQRGIAVVELGHDVSEFPLVALLAQAAIGAGVPSEDVFIFEEAPRWFTPDSTRI